MNPPLSPETIFLNKLPEQMDSPGEQIGYKNPNLIVELRPHTNEHHQVSNVVRVDGRKDGVGPTFLMPAQLDGRIDRRYIAKAAVWATQGGIELIGTDGVGVTHGKSIDNPTARVPGSHLTFEQLTSSVMGNPRSRAIEELRAINQEFGLKSGGHYSFLGISQAGRTIVEWADAVANDQFEQSFQIDRMHFVEPVISYGSVGFRGLYAIIKALATTEAETTRLYDDENKKFAPDAPPRFEHLSKLHEKARRRLGAAQVLATYVAGTSARTGYGRSLQSAMKDPSSPARLHEAEWLISQFAHSTVSLEEDGKQFARSLRDLGATNVQHKRFFPADGDPTPLGHGTLDSLIRTVAFVEIVLARQEVASFFDQQPDSYGELVA